MPRALLIAVAGIILTSPALGQSSSELGISLGSSSFLGDLGGSKDIGRAFIYDLDLQATRPVGGIVYRNNLSKRLALRLNGYFGQVWGDDTYANTATTPGEHGWHRLYRNLSFKSHILELSMMMEFNIMPYQAGSLQDRFAPYILVGIGAVHFEPRARLNGTWYKLRDYSTEGQGFAQFPNKPVYSNIAIAFPLGGGVKYNLSKKYGLNFEIAHRLTTSDYIDDVSTTYIDPNLFFANLPAQEAAIAAALHDRSDFSYPDKTTPGQQRGDPSDKDGYSFVGILTLTYLVSNRGPKGLFCPQLKGF